MPSGGLVLNGTPSRMDTYWESFSNNPVHGHKKELVNMQYYMDSRKRPMKVTLLGECIVNHLHEQTIQNLLLSPFTGIQYYVHLSFPQYYGLYNLHF